MIILIRKFVKKNRKYSNGILLGLIVIILAFAGCDEPSEFGIEALPDGDLITIKNIVVRDDISSYTFREDSIRTDKSRKSLLGSINDPVFGKTNIDFAAQFRLSSFPDYGENPQADSIKLFLFYREVYGDTVTAQKFKVYELDSPLDVDKEYNQYAKLKTFASDKLLGETEYINKVKLDENKDTLYQLITVPLDTSLAEKLLNADSTDMINNDVFLEYFKGLYVESEQISDDGGSILYLEAASSSSFKGSALLMYYNNEEIRGLDADSSLAMPFIISGFSARVNNIEHDYTDTPFGENINKRIDEDSLIYVQSTGGLKSSILIENLASWKDSVNVAINKAELIFQVDTIASDIENFAPPSQLLFTVVNDNGEEYLPIDYIYNPAYFGGQLREDYTYHFNITQHLQELINGTVNNYGFFLSPANKNDKANRVVLKGARSTTGVKLIITYSKYRI